ncbi:hypothetical protein M2165_002823 [Variovorax sp. TBS-050B]|nr:hypothetical protein [Variovorax sp. TBS-050B]
MLAQRDQAPVGQRHQPRGKPKFFVEVNRQCDQNVFRGCEAAFQGV